MELKQKELTRTGSLCSPDPQDQLLTAFKDRDLQSFRDILTAGTKQGYIDPNHWYDDPHHGTLLDLACRTSQSGHFVKLLLEAEANPNKINPVRKKTPLHFAVETKDLPSLEYLLKSPKTDPNILDNTGNTPLHLAAKLENIQFLVCLLNHPNINVNISNKKGQTALHIAADQENKDAVLTLIEVDGIDLDGPKTASGKTPRNLMLLNFPELKDKLPDSNKVKENGGGSVNKLFNLLHRHETDSFLATIRIHTSVLDSNDGSHTFLQYACDYGLFREAEALIRLGADPNAVSATNKRTPIMLASYKGYVNIVRLLAHQELTRYNPVDGETVLHSVIKGATETQLSLGATNEYRNHYECLTLLLKDVPRTKLNINCGDIKGNTVLHYAAKQGDRDFILLLLHGGAYVGQRNNLGEPALADVNPKYFEMYLDECLTTNKKLPREDNYEIIFKYNFLAPPKVSPATLNSSQVTLQLDTSHSDVEPKDEIIPETDPLLYMSCSPDLRPLLTHPVLTSFIHLKWHRIRRFFYLNLTFYVIFWALLTGYILGYYGATTQPDELPETNTSRSTRDVHQQIHDTLEESTMAESLKLFVTIFLIILTLREIFQLAISPLRYLTSPENWLEIILISVTISILFCTSCIKVRHQISAVAILLSWAELVLLIGRHPALSTNIEMLKTVSWNFLKFLAWYSILIIAFALCFYTLFRDSRNEDDNFFLDPAMSVFKTVVMLTGEFDAGSIPFVTHPGVSHILFVIFVFLIAIVLFNLLNGLAVNDTQAIRADAELVGYVSRVKLVSYVETMAMGDPTPCKDLITKLRTLCCFVPNIDCYSTQFACLRMFSKKISLFSEISDYEVRVLPNQENKIETAGSGHYRKRQELDDENNINACIETCKSIHMEASIVRAAKNVLLKKADNEHDSQQKQNDADKNKLLLEYSKRLDKYNETLNEMKRENQKTQEILVQILSAVQQATGKGLLPLSSSDDDNQ